MKKLSVVLLFLMIILGFGCDNKQSSRTYQHRDEPVKENREKAEEDIAIEMARKSDALWRAKHENSSFASVPETERSNESLIRHCLQEEKGELRIFGWKAKMAEPDVYYVCFFAKTQSTGLNSFSFEVNLKWEIVRCIDDDEDLQVKYSDLAAKIATELTPALSDEELSGFKSQVRRGITGTVEFNEASAINNLKLLVSTEATWKQTDADGNGRKDFWDLDVSCLHRMFRANGTTKINFIDISLAKADGAPYSPNEASPFTPGAPDDIEPWPNHTPQPKSGYFFRAMLKHLGTSLKQNTLGANSIPIGHDNLFAFVAYPAEYPKTGIHTFIIDAGGTIYQTDCGINGDGKIVLDWPNDPPTAVRGPGDKYWEPAE